MNVASGGDQTTRRNFSPENVLAFRLAYTNFSSFHWVSRLITSRKCLERKPNVYSIALARAADRLIHLLSVRRLFLAWRMKIFALTVLRVAAQREKFSAFTCSFQSISVVIESPRHCTMCSPCPEAPKSEFRDNNQHTHTTQQQNKLKKFWATENFLSPSFSAAKFSFLNL